MQQLEKTFKDRLIDELEYQGISKKEFAEKTGISTNTLNMYLYRNSIPSADIAVKMAGALNTTVEYLVCGKKTENSVLAFQRNELLNILNSLNRKQTDCFLEIARNFKNALSD